MSNDSSSGLELVRTAAYRAVSGAWTEPVALACSGGIDSTALLVVAAEALRREKVPPFVVMHVDHGTRPETVVEAGFVRAICVRNAIPFVSLRLSDASAGVGQSAEAVWRDMRYDALGAAARRMGLSTVVTAHTRDDQVETVLMRLLTGSSQFGMQDVSSRWIGADTFTLLRPLLGVGRNALRDVLAIAKVQPFEDPSNQDTRYRRNAIRHDLVPVLERVFPGYEGALLRSAALRRLDAEYADTVARGAFESIRLASDESGVALDRLKLAGLHPAIATRVVRLAAKSLISGGDDRELTFERIDAVLHAISGRSGAVLELPYGVRARIERDVVRVWTTTKGGPVD